MAAPDAHATQRKLVAAYSMPSAPYVAVGGHAELTLAHDDANSIKYRVPRRQSRSGNARRMRHAAHPLQTAAKNNLLQRHCIACAFKRTVRT